MRSPIQPCLLIIMPFIGARAAALEYVPIDFSAFHNRSLQGDYDRQEPAGPLPLGNVTLGTIPFMIPHTGNNYWNAYYAQGPNPRQIEIAVGRRGVVTAHALINSLWGIGGPTTSAFVEFVWANGATHRVDLVGNDSVRDYYDNKGDWTQIINGESTIQVWGSSGQRHRLDMQTVKLPVDLQSEVLETVRVVDVGRDPSDGASPPYQRIFLAGLTLGTESAPALTVDLKQQTPRCVSVILNNPEPLRGGEIGIAYEPTELGPIRVQPGVDLPPGSSIYFQTGAPSSCSPQDAVAGGLTLGWLLPPETGIVLPPGRNEVLRICFEFNEAVVEADCSRLRFVGCLGPEGAPIRNVVTGEDGKSHSLSTVDGNICRLAEVPFRRGDANQDAAFDISDPIAILTCLFLETSCAYCLKAMDANDDGLLNLTDAVYLLTWRFLSGAVPPAPFPECGEDPTPDEVPECALDIRC